MSTYLELCQSLRREAGISGTDSMPSAVTGQTGEMRRVVGWIDRAYQDVQNLHSSWRFLKDDFSFATILNTTTYTKSSVSLEELATWKERTIRCYLTATGTSDEQDLIYLPWDNFRACYLYAGNRALTGRPSHYSINDDDSLEIWPKPSAAYTIAGEYYKRAQTMTANADEPIFPEQFHDILIWRAIVFYAGYEAAPEVYSHAQSEYKRLLSAMRRNQLPRIMLGGALA